MHMPGHKGGRFKLIDDLYKVDVTEVAETDHLYDAEGILAESMARLSDFYGSKRSIYLVNGSTVGILSALGGLHKAHDAILVARNCHHSVYSGLIMYQLKPTYIYPKITQWGLLGGIDPEEVRKALAANPEIVSFIMTSPTYDGFISDIRKIKALCDRYNVVLIVDEAHGAHLPYSHDLPESALASRPGVVIHSVHKTLPVITGASLLHMNLAEEEEKSVLKVLARLQTSSPSYIMMAQMDACVQVLGNNEQMWKEHLENIDNLNKSLKKMKRLYALTDYVDIREGIIAHDPAKSLIISRGTVDNGWELSKRLRETFKIQMELEDGLHMLGIITLADSKKALKNYGRALLKLDKKTKKNINKGQVYAYSKQPLIQLQPYQAEDQETVEVSLDQAIDQVSATMITPYPPGIPVIVPGEVITADLIEEIQAWLEQGMDVLGIVNGKIDVIKVTKDVF